MGYLLSSLTELPIDDTVKVYIFTLKGKWNTDLNQIIESNFPNLAREIGTDAVIAKGLIEAEWNKEIGERYLGDDFSKYESLIPALLITDTHPERLTDQSMRILISLNKVKENFDNFDQFFNLLIKFVREKDTTIFSLIEKKENVAKNISGMFELKPNIAGIGININAILDYFFSKK